MVESQGGAQFLLLKRKSLSVTTSFLWQRGGFLSPGGWSWRTNGQWWNMLADKESSIKTLDQVIAGCQTSAAPLSCHAIEVSQAWLPKSMILKNFELLRKPLLIIPWLIHHAAYIQLRRIISTTLEKNLLLLSRASVHIYTIKLNYRAHYAIVWCFSSWYCTAIDDKLFLMGHTRLRDPTTQFMWRVNESGWVDSELFYSWMEEIFLVHAVPQRPVILL